MKRTNLAGLAVLNIALLIVLGVLCLTPRPAEAQLRGGDYLMIAGENPGDITDAVYILELNSAQLLVVKYDRNQQDVIVIGGRDIGGDVTN